MAKNFKVGLERHHSCKQPKRFLESDRVGYQPARAKSTADKINLAGRVYKYFHQIVTNCSVDVRNLTLKELSLAKNLSWVIKRSVEVKPKKRVPKDIPVDLLNSEWFQQAQTNPFLVASVLSRITDCVIIFS